MRLAISLALVVVAGSCKKDAPPPPPAVDTLWALAPDKLAAGIVGGPNAVAAVDPVIDQLRALAKDPELDALHAVMSEIDTVLGGPDVRVADAGFALDKGFAFFQTEDGALLGLIPMTDRDKLVKTLKGTRGAKPTDPDTLRSLVCQPMNGMYACARDKAAFDRIGKGAAQAIGARVAKAGARGDVEFFAGKTMVDTSGYDELVASATIARGQIDVRGFLAGKPTGAIAPLVTAARPKPELANPGGFVVANLSPMITSLLRESPDVQLPGVVTPAQVVGSLTGQMTGVMAAGLDDYNVRLPLADPAPLTKLLAHCSELAPYLPLAAQQTPGACRVALQSVLPVELDAWVEGNELRIASHKGAPATGKRDVTDALAHELSGGGWSYAMWGRGSIFATGVQFPPLPAALPPQAALMIRGLGAISEIGLGVKVDADGIRVHAALRTIWSNPPAIADKLAAITADAIVKNQASALAKPIADGNPDAPFATDFASGQSGMMAPVAVIGMFAAIAIPAFVGNSSGSKPDPVQP